MNKLLTTIALLCFSVTVKTQSISHQSTGVAFTLKLLKRTGENFFSSLAYEGGGMNPKNNDKDYTMFLPD